MGTAETFAARLRQIAATGHEPLAPLSVNMPSAVTLERVITGPVAGNENCLLVIYRFSRGQRKLLGLRTTHVPEIESYGKYDNVEEWWLENLEEPPGSLLDGVQPDKHGIRWWGDVHGWRYEPDLT
jgi:hypothetical protein